MTRVAGILSKGEVDSRGLWEGSMEIARAPRPRCRFLLLKVVKKASKT